MKFFGGLVGLTPYAVEFRYTPVFSGTRVPVRILIEHLEAGDRIDDFLDSYPTVSREQAIAVLEVAKTALLGATW